MKYKGFPLVLLAIVCTHTSWARDFDFRLAVGDSYVDADFNVRFPAEESYFRTGLGGTYRSWDSKRFQMIHGTVGVGSNALVPGLRCDLGFRPFIGEAKKHTQEDTVGGLGFNVSAHYTLPKESTTIPITFFGETTWAPDVLSFAELDRYLEFYTGVRFNILENAAVVAAYHYREFTMDKNWGLSDSIPSIGLVIGF